MIERLKARRDAIALELQAAKICKDAGLIGGRSGRETLHSLRNVRRFGALGAGVVNSAAKYGDRAAFIDERGAVSFAETDRASNAIADSWRALGAKAGDRIAILARNHRGLPLAVYAAAKLGARIVLLNTDFAGPQLRDVTAREGVDLLVYDDEFAARVEGVAPRLAKVRAWADTPGEDTLDALAASGDPAPMPPPAQSAKVVVLTSGTTGTPKGAPRSDPRSLVPVAAVLERVAFRSKGTVELCPPLFHSLGFGYMSLFLALGSTMVLRRRFDPEGTLASIERHHSDGMILVPNMLRRILDLGDDASARHDVSSMRAILAAGSQVGGELAERAQRAFGPVLHNLYGSTEVAYATIATPEDLAAAPACVGKACTGTVVRLLDERGNEVPHGTTGRIFVRNAIPFDGYTGGESKEVIDGLMASGDIGHFDSEGRLFIDGRDDEMLVSGGENVFPREVEELLEHHEDVAMVAAIGVPDDIHGQRLRAFVVRTDGAAATEDELKDYVKRNLARYKVPREILFLDDLPRNATGKILKRELRLIEHSL